MVKNSKEEHDNVVPIAKPPKKFSLDRFKVKREPAIAGVNALLTELPHHPISHAKDFVRLHPNEETYWSGSLCFVNVPIFGVDRDTLHLIDEELALQFVQSRKILRFELALATMPYDVRFLCHVPTTNKDNSWNKSNLLACVHAKTRWVQATSRKEENVDGYKIEYAQDADAFPEPKWPTQTLEEIIGATFAGRNIEHEDDDALGRLIGRKPKLA
jgi:hypothetical protein